MGKNIISTLLILFIPTISVLNTKAQHGKELIKQLQIAIESHDAQTMQNQANALLKLASNQNNDTLKLEATKFLGIAYLLHANYDSCLFWSNKALKLGTQLKDSLNMGKALINIANAYKSLGNFEQAINYTLQAQLLFEATKNAGGLARTNNMLGIFNYYKKDFDSALSYFKIYHQQSVLSGDSGEIVSALNNLSAVYSELGEFMLQRQLLKESIHIQEQRNNGGRIGSAYENLAGIYLRTDSFDTAIKYYDKAHAAYKMMDAPYNIVRNNINYAVLYTKMKRYSQAQKYFDLAIQGCENAGFLELKENALLKLSDLHVQQGNYKNAYTAMKERIEIKDSILNKENQASINEMQIKYETEKKERQLLKTQFELEKTARSNQRKIFIIISLIGTLLTISLIAMLVLFRQRSKYKETLATQKIHMQKHQMNVMIQSQESERQRFARDLHDGFGQLITALKIGIHQLAEEPNTETKMNLTLKSEKMLNDMHHQIREIAHNLMPDVLLNEGLIGAVKDYALRINQSGKFKVEVVEFGLTNRLKDNIEIGMYRVIQEWMNNVMKHSSAQNISIQLTGYDNEVNIVIEDDGAGFNPALLEKGKGWGWKNIQSRLEAIKATIDIDTETGRKGTSFIVNVPLVTA